MSRIGKLPILLPSTVKVDLKDNFINISGPHGSLSREIPKPICVSISNGQIVITTKDNTRIARQLFGLCRSLLNNMVIGVSKKFEQQLEIKGVGYRAQIAKNQLTLNLGYSHPIILTLPSDIEVNVDSNTQITVRGNDKEKVGKFAAIIRSKRPPEPYKGKGVMYKGEVIKRKVGKSGK